MLSLTRWRPFNEMTDSHRDVDRVFGRLLGDWPAAPEWSWLPATEATSGSEGWTLRMALPGIDPKDVHVELTGRVLTISGERSVKDEQTAPPSVGDRIRTIRASLHPSGRHRG